AEGDEDGFVGRVAIGHRRILSTGFAGRIVQRGSKFIPPPRSGVPRFECLRRLGKADVDSRSRLDRSRHCERACVVFFPSTCRTLPSNVTRVGLENVLAVTGWLSCQAR